MGIMTSLSNFELWFRGYSVAVMATGILVALVGANHNASTTPGTTAELIVIVCISITR